MNATDTTNAIRDRATQAGKEARDEIKDVIDKTADKVQPVADRLASGAKDGLQRASETLDKTAVTLAERGRQIAVAYEGFAESGAGFVRKRPAVSLLVAAAAGYGLSKLLRSGK